MPIPLTPLFGTLVTISINRAPRTGRPGPVFTGLKAIQAPMTTSCLQPVPSSFMVGQSPPDQHIDGLIMVLWDAAQFGADPLPIVVGDLAVIPGGPAAGYPIAKVVPVPGHHIELYVEIPKAH